MRIGIVLNVESGKDHGDVGIASGMDAIVSNASGKFTGCNHFTAWSIGMVIILIKPGSVKLEWKFTWVMEENRARTI
jgi:hypothetical protein